MADAKPEPESVLAFVNKHYKDLKKQAQDDPPNDKITAVIVPIDELYKTITTTGDISHEKIVEQLNALKTQYNELGSQLGDDITSYPRYIDANTSLIMIVDGFNEVDAGEGEAEGVEGVDAG